MRLSILASMSQEPTRSSLFTIDDREVRVIALDDLLRVKEHVRRPKDLEVAAELRAIRDAKKGTT